MIQGQKEGIKIILLLEGMHTTYEVVQHYLKVDLDKL